MVSHDSFKNHHIDDHHEVISGEEPTISFFSSVNTGVLGYEQEIGILSNPNGVHTDLVTSLPFSRDMFSHSVARYTCTGHGFGAMGRVEGFGGVVGYRGLFVNNNGSVGDTLSSLAETFSQWGSTSGIVIAVMYLVSLFFVSKEYFSGGGLPHCSDTKFETVDEETERRDKDSSLRNSSLRSGNEGSIEQRECCASHGDVIASAGKDKSKGAEPSTSHDKRKEGEHSLPPLSFQENLLQSRRGAVLWGQLMASPEMILGTSLKKPTGAQSKEGLLSSDPYCAARAFGEGPRPYSLDHLKAVHGVKHIAVIMDGNRRFGKEKAKQEGSQKGNLWDAPPLLRDSNDDQPSSTARGSDSNTQTDGIFANLLRRSVAVLKAAGGMAEKVLGHKAGAEKLLEFIRYCIEFNIPILTVYAFSTENWNRPSEEIDILMAIFALFFEKMREESRMYGIYCRFIVGDSERINPDILALMHSIESETSKLENIRITMNILVSYGGRLEICDAVNSLYEEQEKSSWCNSFHITERAIGKRLLKSLEEEVEEEEEGEGNADKNEEESDNKEKSHRDSLRRHHSFIRSHDPDIIYRTSGESRISNFLLYQSAYSELIFTTKAWPAVEKKDLEAVLVEYCCRSRRFGK